MAPATIFTHSLALLRAMLRKIEADGAGASADAGAGMLAARLHPDMLPFAQHVKASANFALRGCCPVAGLDTVNFNQDELSFAALEACRRDRTRFDTPVATPFTVATRQPCPPMK